MRYAQALVVLVAAGVLAMLALQKPQAQAPDLSGTRTQAGDPARFLVQDATQWKPDNPFDLSGPMPKDEDVSRAIAEGLELVLAKQDANGGWDEEDIAFAPGKDAISATAKHAADATSMTALCCMALRAHAGYDPERINVAIERGVTFVMNQVFRGRLRLDVYYAVWRYSMGLQLLANEYRLCKDENRKAEMQSCARRMVNALLKLQMTNGESRLIDRVGKRNIAEGASVYQLPGSLGLVLEAPTDADFRGGALVKDMWKDGPAHVGGIQIGDRIIEVEGLRVENAIDYYQAEAEFLRGQRVSLKVKRKTGDTATVTCDIPLAWAAYLGIEVGGDKDNKPRVTTMFQLSPAQMAGVAVGDIIIELGGAEIKTPQDYYNQLYKLQINEVASITILRGEEQLSGQVQAVLAPESDLGIFLSEDDYSSEPGVRVGDSMMRGQLGSAFEVPGPGGAALGMKPGDRLTHINNIPILYPEQAIAFAATIPAGIQVAVRFTQNGVAKEGVLVTRARYSQGSLGVILDVSGPMDPPKIKKVLQNGPAAAAGIQAGDIIVSLAGAKTPTHIFYTRTMAKFLAGQTIDIVVSRGGKLLMGKVTLSKADKAFTDIEEGGWSYYPFVGESMTFVTSATIMALQDAGSVLGIKAPIQALKAAETVVDNLRCLDATDGMSETYAYRRGEITIESKRPGSNRYFIDQRGCMGRNAVCELALVRAGRRTKQDLERTLTTWIKHRGELDRVRNFPGTHYQELYNNAAYYWLYGHIYSLKAAREIGGAVYDRMNETVVKAIMLKREKTGGWMHHSAFGKTCGTAMALLALGESKGGWRK